ncbi:hypothetical protein JL720_16888 [Aureococcus anophagefferens]|nr:hypothetical protein JL720_16888 [Aureococcus anophagefferens]
MIPMAPEPASARDALRAARGARPARRSSARGGEAVEEEAVPEDAAASRASLMEAFAARDRERADLREADRQRRKEERRRERREAAKVAAAANVAAERSDDLLRSKRERKSQASLNSGAAPLNSAGRRAAESARGDAPPRSARGAAPLRSARRPARSAATPLRSARGDAPRRPDSREVLSARNDVERAELWRELGDYANAIRSAKDADGAPTRRSATRIAGDATDGPGTARSLASSASDAVFLTEKRPRSKRSRFRDRNR